MKEFKKYFLQIFLYIEIIIFSFFYLFGSNGLKSLHDLENQNNSLTIENNLLKQEINELQSNITQWDNDPFYKEKIAREQLQMARPDEEIYLVKS